MNRGNEMSWLPHADSNFMSEVLILGTYSEGGVILITPDKKVKNGDKLG